MKRMFLILEGLIYFLFLTLDLFKINSTYIKYLGIILCFIFAIYSEKKVKKIAMFFTLVSDLFLLVLNRYYEIGLISFIIVQLTYFYFLGNINKAYFNMFLYIRGLIIILGSILLVIFNSFTLLNELVLIYFTNLLLNTLEAWLSNNKTLAIGLSLFVCCDICVGLYNINAANNIAAFLMWFFYLPSQVLIVLS